MDRIDALKQEQEGLKNAGDQMIGAAASAWVPDARAIELIMIELIVEELHYLRYREVEVEVRRR